MRLAVVLALVIGCGGAPTCTACDMCPGATQVHYFSDLNAMVCWCANARVTRNAFILGVDLPKGRQPDSVVVKDSECGTDWDGILAAHGGSCDPVMGDNTMYGSPVCGSN